MSNGECPVGAANTARITILEGAVTSIQKDIKDVRDRFSGRPTWGVTILITGLVTVCTSLIVFIVANGGG